MRTTMSDVMKVISNLIMWFGILFIVLGFVCIIYLAFYTNSTKQPLKIFILYGDILNNRSNYLFFGIIASFYFFYSIFTQNN